jgi:hypothetical protein
MESEEYTRERCGRRARGGRGRGGKSLQKDQDLQDGLLEDLDAGGQNGRQRLRLGGRDGSFGDKLVMSLELASTTSRYLFSRAPAERLTEGGWQQERWSGSNQPSRESGFVDGALAVDEQKSGVVHHILGTVS